MSGKATQQKAWMQFDYGQTFSLFAKKYTDNSFAMEAAWTRTKELDLFTDFQILP